MSNRATFTSMESSTAGDWQRIGGEFEPIVRCVFAQPQASLYKAATAVAA